MNVAATIMAAELVVWVANFSVEQMAAGGTHFQIRVSGARPHRSPPR